MMVGLMEKIITPVITSTKHRKYNAWIWKRKGPSLNLICSQIRKSKGFPRTPYYIRTHEVDREEISFILSSLHFGPNWEMKK